MNCIPLWDIREHSLVADCRKFGTCKKCKYNGIKDFRPLQLKRGYIPDGKVHRYINDKLVIYDA